MALGGRRSLRRCSLSNPQGRRLTKLTVHVSSRTGRCPSSPTCPAMRQQPCVNSGISDDASQRTADHRRRPQLMQRCQHRPISHVAVEMGVSRACASKWVNRFWRFGELGLQYRSSAPRCQPAATATAVILAIEELRRTRKWSATHHPRNERGLIQLADRWFRIGLLHRSPRR